MEEAGIRWTPPHPNTKSEHPSVSQTEGNSVRASLPATKCLPVLHMPGRWDSVVSKTRCASCSQRAYSVWGERQKNSGCSL